MFVIHTYNLRRHAGSYDGTGSSANRSFWQGREYDDRETAVRIAKHIVESGYVQMAQVAPVGFVPSWED